MHSKQRPLYTENNRSAIEPERFMSNGRIRAYGDVWTVADRANRVRSLHRVIGQLLWCSCTGECRKSRHVPSIQVRARFDSATRVRRPGPNTCKLAQQLSKYRTKDTLKLPSLQLRCCPSRSTTFLNRTSSKAWTIKTPNKHQAFKLHSALAPTDFPTANALARLIPRVHSKTAIHSTLTTRTRRLFHFGTVTVFNLNSTVTRRWPG
jgi:hypothetical protein